MLERPDDTIAAIASASGMGGIGVVRISGPLANSIALIICNRKKPLHVRHAHFLSFFDEHGECIDEGVVLFFRAPHSFTGEDVIELQGHGGPVVLQRVLSRVLQLGARLARPGEFSERAFLNNKLDLLQAEAVADLIASSSERAARSAIATLKGVFSKKVDQLYGQLVSLRMHVEAAIDFPEDEVDFLSDEILVVKVDRCIAAVNSVLLEAKQGMVLNDGIRVALVGPPNAGKSSLMNCLVGSDRSIVTDIPGTTRDVVSETLILDGLMLHFSDTAGIRNSDDPVESEGIRRSHLSVNEADLIIMLFALDEKPDNIENWWKELTKKAWPVQPVICVFNKIDLVNHAPSYKQIDNSLIVAEIYCSLKSLQGFDGIKLAIKQAVAYDSGSGQFSARKRHVDALELCLMHLRAGRSHLLDRQAGELLAEELRLSSNALGELTGVISADDLLGKIFSSFCIGK